MFAIEIDGDYAQIHCANVIITDFFDKMNFHKLF